MQSLMPLAIRKVSPEKMNILNDDKVVSDPYNFRSPFMYLNTLEVSSFLFVGEN